MPHEVADPKDAQEQIIDLLLHLVDELREEVAELRAELAERPRVLTY